MSQAVGRVQRSTVELVRRYVDVCEIEISLRFLRARRNEWVRVRDAFLAQMLLRILVTCARDVGK